LESKVCNLILIVIVMKTRGDMWDLRQVGFYCHLEYKHTHTHIYSLTHTQTHTQTHNITYYLLVERNIQKLSGGLMLIINWFVNNKVTLIKT
jgi:hypothetical protein